MASASAEVVDRVFLRACEILWMLRPLALSDAERRVLGFNGAMEVHRIAFSAHCRNWRESVVS